MKTHRADKAHTFTSRIPYAGSSFPSRITDGNMTPKMKRQRAFGYVRVSTDMQTQFGLSLDAQQNQIAAYAKDYGYEVIGFYVDQDLAKNTTGRPEQIFAGAVSRRFGACGLLPGHS